MNPTVLLLLLVSPSVVVADADDDDIGATPSLFSSRPHDENGRAISPNGALVAAQRMSEISKSLYVYDRVSGRAVHKFPRVDRGGCCFTPDNTRLVCVRDIRDAKAGPDRIVPCTLDVHDLRTGRLLSSTPLKPGQPGWLPSPVCWACVADDVALVAGTREVATVYDLRNGGVVGDLPGKPQKVTGVAMSADGRWAAVSDDRNVLRTYDVRTRKLDRTLYEHVAAVQALAVSADGRYVASATEGGMVRVLDRTTGGEKRTHRIFSRQFTGLVFASDGSRLIASAWFTRPANSSVWGFPLGLWQFDWKKEGSRPRLVCLPPEEIEGWSERGGVPQFFAHLMTADGRTFLGVRPEKLAVLDLDDPDGTKAKKRRPAEK